ncbi:MAG: quinolinate synthase NadA [Ignisphaera sp.]
MNERLSVIIVDLVEEVIKLKKKTNATILAHNYQPPEVQDVADFVGDSLELSLKALESKAKLIVFAGVDFMAEQAAILNENAVVLHPDPDARCPMAQMITPDDIDKARKMYPGAPVVVYVNSPALVKAKADYIVTSANALKLVEALDADTVIFGPDKHLAEYISSRTSKRVIAIPPNGHCPVHVNFDPVAVQELLKIYRGAEFIAHPECPYEVRKLANFVGSTSQMVKYTVSSSCRVFLVGTEVGIIYRMVKENRDKVFVPASTNAICSDMKKITLEKILKSLKDRVYVVSVDKEVALKVRKAIENTFSLLGVETPWRK